MGELTEAERLERHGELLLSAIYDEVDQRLNPSGEDCWHCGGEGETYDCIDGCCEDAESGCPDCARPCPECRINAGLRAKAIREEVINSGDLYVAIAWIKSVGRWTDDITHEQVQQQIAAAKAELDSGRAALSQGRR
jgi:hypothetical protein